MRIDMPDDPLPPAERTGIAIVERFYGEVLSHELVEGVRQTPDEQIIVLLDVFDETFNYSKGSLARMQGRADRAEGSYFVGESLVRDHEVPVVQRANLDLILLYFERTVIADPVRAWAEHTFKRRKYDYTQYDSPWRSSSAPLAVQLAAILRGLLDLKPEIDSGSVVLGPPPDPVSGASRWDIATNATALQLMEDTFRRFFTDDGEAQYDFSYFRFLRELDDYFADKTIWRAVSLHLYNGEAASNISGEDPQAEELAELLREAIYFDNYAALNDLVPISMNPSTTQFLQSPFGGQYAARSAIVHVPRLDLSIRDALGIRRGEEAFAAFRRGVSDVMSVAGAPGLGESTIEYSDRLRDAADECLADAVADLTRLRSRGKMLGKWFPTAAGVSFGLGVKVLAPVPIPGASGPAKALSGHLLRRWQTEADAADIALRLVTNLQVAGRL